MNIILGKDETLLKEWVYSVTKQKGAATVTRSIALTDKRIISEASSPYAISHVEIQNKDVEEVDSAFAAARNPKYLVGTVIGVIAAITGAIIKQNIVLYGGLALAVLFLIIFLAVKKCGMDVSVYKRNHEIPVFSVCEGISEVKPRKLFRRKKKKPVRIVTKIDPNVAREIVESISAYINM